MIIEGNLVLKQLHLNVPVWPPPVVSIDPDGPDDYLIVCKLSDIWAD